MKGATGCCWFWSTEKPKTHYSGEIDFLSNAHAPRASAQKRSSLKLIEMNIDAVKETFEPSWLRPLKFSYGLVCVCAVDFRRDYQSSKHQKVRTETWERKAERRLRRGEAIPFGVCWFWCLVPLINRIASHGGLWRIAGAKKCQPNKRLPIESSFGRMKENITRQNNYFPHFSMNKMTNLIQFITICNPLKWMKMHPIKSQNMAYSIDFNRNLCRFGLKLAAAHTHSPSNWNVFGWRVPCFRRRTHAYSLTATEVRFAGAEKATAGKQKII